MEPTLSAAVRQVLVANANKPMRLNAVWDAVQLAAPALCRSKTHFKRRIVLGMFQREEVRWMKLDPDVVVHEQARACNHR